MFRKILRKLVRRLEAISTSIKRELNGAEKYAAMRGTITVYYGLRVSTIPVHSALLDIGMEVSAKSVQEYTRGKEDSAIAPLCTTRKRPQ